ncbi:uncharacterized protein LOC120536568 isoform X2 [Polypterus senegalus]|uniref:uncharacterized protein LOC120536568 isoform X2 n=1 Tax=Polypterus senegalus TaxID=55291 RepID=UPI001965FBF7|nr:uncharacterized protein LOC120536568 isoform X2 [Polypterus senegalus]
MLVKVNYLLQVKKYIKLQDRFTFEEFLNEANDALQVFDETNTNVEEDIFQELVQSNPQICFTVKCPPQGLFSDLDVSGATSTPSTCTDTLSNSSDVEGLERTKLNLSASSNFNNGREITSAEKAKQIVQNALKEKPGGLDVLEEYELTKTLKHSTRRQLVNVLVSHMTEVHGRIPTLKQRETYALGIVSLFPALRDPYSSKGYEHFYDPEKGTGFISWRLKTLSRKNPKRVYLMSHETGGPSRRRKIEDTEQLDGDACREAISLLLHTADETEVRQKMKQTFKHRQELVHNPERSTDILKIFPRFLEVKGLVNQDFILLFNAETSAKLLEQWEMAFKPKVIEEAKSLTLTAELQSHISAAEKQQSEHEWDSDISSFLLLLHLLPPSAGRKKVKISPTDAVDRLVHFHKSCTSIEEHLRVREGHQPYLLAVGRTKKRIDNFDVVVDKQLIPCARATSLSAIDELFKVHYIFNLTYEESLANVYTFLQTTVYNIDVGLTSESPRVRELRVKLLNDV